jgi:hypothetical protein
MPAVLPADILLSRDGTLAKIADVGLAAVVSQKYVSIAGTSMPWHLRAFTARERLL